MTRPKTLRQIANVIEPDGLEDKALVLIDCQNEYVDGLLPLPNIGDALYNLSQLVETFRSRSLPIIHVAHEGNKNGAFDLSSRGGQIVATLSPIGTEQVIRKKRPNAFSDTTLLESLSRLERKAILLCGFMTHMCVSSTARASIDLNISSVVVGDACATKDLPDPTSDDVLAADIVHKVALAEIADRFAAVRNTNDILSWR